MAELRVQEREKDTKMVELAAALHEAEEEIKQLKYQQRVDEDQNKRLSALIKGDIKLQEQNDDLQDQLGEAQESIQALTQQKSRFASASVANERLSAKNEELAQSLTFERFIRRDPLLSQGYKTAILHFILFLRKLAKKRNTGKLGSADQAALMALLESQEITISRSWLKEKISQ